MEENTTQYMSTNQAFNSPNIIQFRLDTTEMIQNIQRFLSGEIYVPVPKPDGSTKWEKQVVGENLANKKGVQHIINYLSGIINPSVVQGNYTDDQYSDHVSRIHKSITRQLLVNYHDWGMQYQDLEMINDVIMNVVETFLSRLIDNKERESYATTMKTTESSRVQEKSRLSDVMGM